VNVNYLFDFFVGDMQSRKENKLFAKASFSLTAKENTNPGPYCHCNPGNKK
jgi:hypothetical protein